MSVPQTHRISKKYIEYMKIVVEEKVWSTAF